MNIFTKGDNDGKSVLVFGSNLAGRHGKGAAFTAKIYWGAVRGQGVRRQGMSYGIPTKDSNLESLSLEAIALHVVDFLIYAQGHPELRFLVTRIGCGYAGYDDGQISVMFKDAPSNCVLPEGWK